MNEESNNSDIEPELEARIIAMLMGEASDFETEELNRLIEQRPELAAFKRRMQKVHGLLQDVGQSEFRAPAADWKLPASKRNAVLAVINGEATVHQAPKSDAVSGPQRATGKRTFLSSLASGAALACVVGIGGTMAWMSFKSNEEASSQYLADSMWDDPRYDRKAFSVGTDITFELNEGLIADTRQSGSVLSSPNRRHSLFFDEDDGKKPELALSAIRDTLGSNRTLPSGTCLDDHVQYFEGDTEFNLSNEVAGAKAYELQELSRPSSTKAKTPASKSPLGETRELIAQNDTTWMSKESRFEGGDGWADSLAYDSWRRLAVPKLPAITSDDFTVLMDADADVDEQASSQERDDVRLKTDVAAPEQIVLGGISALPSLEDTNGGGEANAGSLSTRRELTELDVSGNLKKLDDQNQTSGLADATPPNPDTPGFSSFAAPMTDHQAAVPEQTVEEEESEATDVQRHMMKKERLIAPSVANEGSGKRFRFGMPDSANGTAGTWSYEANDKQPGAEGEGGHQLGRDRDGITTANGGVSAGNVGGFGGGSSGGGGFGGSGLAGLAALAKGESADGSEVAAIDEKGLANSEDFGMSNMFGLQESDRPDHPFGDAENLGRSAGGKQQAVAADPSMAAAQVTQEGRLKAQAPATEEFIAKRGAIGDDLMTRGSVQKQLRSSRLQPDAPVAGKEVNSHWAEKGKSRKAVDDGGSGRKGFTLPQGGGRKPEDISKRTMRYSLQQGGTESEMKRKAVDGEVSTGVFNGRFLSDSLKMGFDLKAIKRPAVKKIVPPAGLAENSAADDAFSTFSLHVSDVSFNLALAALGKGEWPEAAKVRIEEFVNAFDYGDPMPRDGEKVACVVEQSIHPFVQQRNLLRVSMRTAAAGRASSTPLRLTFLLDNSGSMERTDRQQTVRRAFAMLAQQLTPIDQVTLISFARQPRLLADKVTGAEAGKLVQLIDQLPSEGGTNIEAALQLAFEKAREQQTPNAQNRIILLTDGAVNLGNANPESLSQMVTTMRSAGVAFDAAGISAEGLNDEVLEALTRKGDGRYYLLDSVESADDGFARQIAGALRPSAKNVKVQVEFNPKRVGNYKLLGFEKHVLKKEDFRNDKVDAAEMAAAEAGVAMYQFEARPDGEGDVGSVSVRFQDLSTGQMIENRWPIPYEADAPRPDQATASLRVATSAALLAAKLRGEPLGESVDLKTLSHLVSGLPDQQRNDTRVQQLQQMIEQARQLSGK